MREMPNDIRRAAGLCAHGNEPSTCPICAEEKKAETTKTREVNIETKLGKGTLLEAASLSAPSATHPERNEDASAIFAEENVALVADGAGGHRGAREASQSVAREFMPAYGEARQKAYQMNEAELKKQIREIIASSIYLDKEVSYIDPGTGEKKYRENPAFTQEFQKKAKILDDIKIPAQIWCEAAALRETAIALNQKIYERGQQDPNLKDMASTLTSVKLVETPEGRIFAVFLNVGDSEGYLKRGKEAAKRFTVSDSALEILGARGVIQNLSPETAQDPEKLDKWARANLDKMSGFGNYTIGDLKFIVMTQGLGQKTIVPRITIVEVKPGDSIALISDGVGDNDGEGRFKKTMERQDLNLPEQAETIVLGAEEGLKKNEGKGWDDMTAVIIKVAEAGKQYARWVEQLVRRAELSAARENDLRAYLEQEKVHIAGRAIELIKLGQAKDPTEAMEYLGREIIAMFKSR